MPPPSNQLNLCHCSSRHPPKGGHLLPSINHLTLCHAWRHLPAGGLKTQGHWALPLCNVGGLQTSHPRGHLTPCELLCHGCHSSEGGLGPVAHHESHLLLVTVWEGCWVLHVGLVSHSEGCSVGGCVCLHLLRPTRNMENLRCQSPLSHIHTHTHTYPHTHTQFRFHVIPHFVHCLLIWLLER